MVDYLNFSERLAEDFDFFVLSGGPLHISDPEDLKEEKAFLKKTSKPVFGICLGHEILGVTFGSELFELEKKKEGMFFVEILGLKGYLYHSNSWFIKDVPEGFELLRRDGEIITAMRHKTKPFFSVQGHPEKSGEFGRALKDLFIKEFVKK